MIKIIKATIIPKIRPNTRGKNFLPQKLIIGPITINSKANTQGYSYRNMTTVDRVKTGHPAL